MRSHRTFLALPHSEKTISALILVGSLVACSASDGLHTQRAYSEANLEQPQEVSFDCGKLVDVAPAILPNSIPTGVGITPSISRWLVGLHAASSGANAGIKVSAGFLDLNGIASAPGAPTTEYTVLLRTGTNPPNPTLPGEPMSAVVVVQNDLSLYPNAANLQPGTDVVVRVVNGSGRVMASPFGGQCAGNFPWYPQSASLGGGSFPPRGYSELPDWQLYAANHLAAKTPMPVPLQGPVYYPSDTLPMTQSWARAHLVTCITHPEECYIIEWPGRLT